MSSTRKAVVLASSDTAAAAGMAGTGVPSPEAAGFGEAAAPEDTTPAAEAAAPDAAAALGLAAADAAAVAGGAEAPKVTRSDRVNVTDRFGSGLLSAFAPPGSCSNRY